MSWPLSQDFNEAVQTPVRAFADADLKACTVAAGPGGVPRPRSGNFADVYRLDHPDGRAWAVKLFTRPVAPTLQSRYAAVADHLNAANLPFTLPFEYFPDGVRVRGKQYPVVKMPWVDGFPMNQFVRENLGRATVLESMLTLWVRLCRRLRETGMAHADLQHGNVLLVPGGKAGALGLKLVDYDGMYVPELANEPSGELGHPAFQHPERALKQTYSADLDRFPHLVVATALRALLVGGESLWRRYDNGDNLLFGAKDFQNPAGSKLMRELWDTGDPFTVGLVGHLALACGKPLGGTPWLDQLMPEGRPPMLTPSQEQHAGEILGPGSVAVAVEPPRAAAPKSVGSIKTLAAVAGGGVLVIGLLTGGVIAFAGGKATPTADLAKAETPAGVEPVKPADVTPAALDKTSEAPTPAPPPAVAELPKPVVAPSTVPVVAQAPAAEKSFAFAATEGTAFPDNVRLTADAAHVLVAERGTNKVHTFAVKTGAKVATFQAFTGAKQVYVAPLPKNQAIAASNEPALIVYDTLSGKPAGRVPHSHAAIAAISASKDGKYVLIVGDKKATVIDLDSGTEVLGKESAVPASAVLAAASPWVAVADPVGVVGISPLKAGKAGFLNPKLGPVLLQAWEPKNHRVALRKIAAGKTGGDIHVWVTEAPFAEVKVLAGPYMPCPPAFSADGSKFFAAKENAVEVWDTATWAKTGEHKVRGAEVIALDISDDGAAVVAVAADKKCHVFGTPSAVAAVPNPGGAGETMPSAPAKVAAALKPVWAVPYDDDATRSARAIVASLDGTKFYVADTRTGPTHVFDAATGKKLHSVADTAGPVHLAALTNGKVLAHVIDAPSAKVWEDTGGRVVDTIRVPGGNRGTVVGGSPDGRSVLIKEGGVGAGKYSLLDADTGRTTPLTDAGRGTARFSADGSRVVVADGPKLKIFSADGRILTSFDLPCASAAAAALGAGGRFALVLPTETTGAAPPSFLVIDTATGKTVRQLAGPFAAPRPGTVTALHGFSREGKWFAAVRRPAAGEDFRLEIYDAATWQPVGWSADPVFQSAGFAYTPDGTKAVVWGQDRMLRAYELPAGPASAAPPAVVVTPPATAGPGRKPAPSPEALAAGDAVVRAAYKDDFAKRTPADRKKLAERLLKDAADTMDLGGKYVMQKEAIAAAADANDLALAFRAADQLGGEFDVDAASLKVQAVEKVAAATSLTAVLRGTAEAATELAEEYADKDQFDPAVRLLGLAASCYGKASLTTLRIESEGRQAQVKKLRDAFEPVKAAAAAFKANPQDLAAAAVVGKYRCFVQRRWDEGLPLLAAAADGKLKELAELDAKAATDLETTDLKRADAWSAYAATLPEAERPAVQLRARYWYAKALTNLRGGLERLAAENKLAFTVAGTEYRPGLVCETLAVPGKKKLRVKLEPGVDASGNDFRGFTPTVGVRYTGYLVPPVPGRYRLIADTTEVVLVKVGAGSDQKTVIDAGVRRDAKRDAVVLLGEKPTPVVVEVVFLADPTRTVKLKWVRPGTTAEEVVPADALYHPKAAEKDLTEK